MTCKTLYLGHETMINLLKKLKIIKKSILKKTNAER